MRIFSVVGGGVVGQETICHLQAYQGDTSLEGLQVLLINTHPKKELLFSYVFPGTAITLLQYWFFPRDITGN